MELKTYQKQVIKDLSRYLELIKETQSAKAAYAELWYEKNVKVGSIDGMPNYKDILNGVPNVCFKVPTGGGKTLLACSSIKPIFDSMTQMRAKAVVWLVPSDAILTQTYSALSSPDHPYRQKLDVAFGSRLEVYSKEQLLNGQNFNPTSVTEQLSIFVLSYDSFRTSKKDGRKAYQENGNLASFAKYNTNMDAILEDTDETALIQVIRQLNPVVIVDESHHATSKLSIEMLQNFNPCFVLDLTATPAKGSNIISFVDAVALKKENMVKLPVIVFNRNRQDDVFVDAINVRQKLEYAAEIEQKSTGRYIRPIVLFQAQPKISGDSTTFEKIKKTLIEAGIKEEEIAIKTADINELKNHNLMSPACPIRYIITVNALKEGWDCPFAYVLATVANKTSSVDVEQILGRVLRLPDTKKNQNNVLNISYVITSSNNFQATLDQVVEGLNAAGFSRRDYYAEDLDAEDPVPQAQPQPTQQLTLDDIKDEPKEDDVPEINPEDIRNRIDILPPAPEDNDDVTSTDDLFQNDELFTKALDTNKEYEKKVQQDEPSALNQVPEEVRDKMNQFQMDSDFVDEASQLQIPQFMIEMPASFFSDSEYELLKTEHLYYGFTLKDKDTVIDFRTLDADIAEVDIKKDTPKAWMMNTEQGAFFKDAFLAQPSEKRLALCKGLIQNHLSRMDCVDDRELKDYIDRVVDNMDSSRVADLEQSPLAYANVIKNKIHTLLEAHAEKTFDRWFDQNKIACQPNFRFHTTISPTTFIESIPKSLYTAEESMNEYERKVIWKLSSLDNIKWWHRNMSRVEFSINGFINAYPDIIAYTTSGKILLIETKGDHLDNEDSKQKAKLGSCWAQASGSRFKYFMVFQTIDPGYQGSYSYERFIDIVKEL